LQKGFIKIVFIMLILPLTIISLFDLLSSIIQVGYCEKAFIIFVLVTTNTLVSYIILYQYIKNVKGLIKDIIRVNKEISKGNFAVAMHYHGEDKELKELTETYSFMAKTLSISNELADDKADRINAILESLADAVIAVDNLGRIVTMNYAAENIFGISRQVSGKHLIEVIRNYELYGFIYKCMNTGDSDVAEIKHSPGERLLRVHATPYKDKAGKTLGIVIIVRDITEFRRLEKVRTEFVANVSHELRTPLTSIKGFVETLLDGAYKDPKTAERFLKIIDMETAHLNRIISELLDLSQLESSKVKMNIRAIDLKVLVDEVLIIFEERFKKKNIDFSYSIPTTLSKIAADYDWLRQVFINLIDNAIKYTPEGGKIYIEAEEIEEFVKVKIIDNGIGIPEEDIPRVFERFYRMDKARSRQIRGTGLGLSIVKHIIKNLGGEITVESRPNQGTMFIFTIKKA
jgi:two-component system phosphate regulon sensor histidine kinase PhoR